MNRLQRRLSELRATKRKALVTFITAGDPDMETLYITARTSVYRVRLGVKGALPY